MKIIRILALVIVGSFGVLSLLATCCEQPPPGVEVNNELIIHTINPAYNPKTVFIPEYRPESHMQRYACPNEKIRVSWNIKSGNEGTLDATPKNALNPIIKAMNVSGEGSLETVILEKADITLESKYTFRTSVFMIPETICSGYPIIPIGKFSGTLIQEKPIQKSFEQKASFIWSQYGNVIELDMAVAESPATTEGVRKVGLRCSYQEAKPNLVCMQTRSSSNIEQLTIFIDITAKGLEGTFFGKELKNQKDLTSFSGRLKLARE